MICTAAFRGLLARPTGPRLRAGPLSPGGGRQHPRHLHHCRRRMKTKPALPEYDGPRKTALESIRLFCVGCMGGSFALESECPSVDCAFYPSRMGGITNGASRRLLKVIRRLRRLRPPVATWPAARPVNAIWTCRCVRSGHSAGVCRRTIPSRPGSNDGRGLFPCSGAPHRRRILSR